jgi:tRNA threonylcarbamoyladenosine biosynthesis protein TsaB
MLILGIETSTQQTSVCLADQSGIVASAALGRGRAHGEFVAPAIEFCLRSSGCSVAGLAGIAVSLGPGLYTGMRVGIATAQALAHARRLPVVGLSSLDLLALPVRHARRTLCSVVDARRGELFWALYRPAPGGVQRVTEVRVGRPAALAGEIEALRSDVLAVGDGALVARTELESVGVEIGSTSMAYPTAEALVELAMPRFLREDTQRPEDLRPTYLRKADARIGWRNRGALVGGRPADDAARGAVRS